MSVLTGDRIKEELARGIEEGLVITPLLTADQVSEASVDVRLGNEFILLRKRTFQALDIADRSSLRDLISKYQEKVRIEFRQPFILHPNQFVLGSTLEYVKLPPNLGCHIIGKSSWGRLGLVIETASAVAPGYRGCVTLELVNVGDVPLVLYPGLRIAQLVFHTMDGRTRYSGRYSCATGPQFSRVYTDSELDFWCPDR